MKRIKVGQKIYFSILAIFLVFAVSFIVFQQHREKQYKASLINTKLQDCNSGLERIIKDRGLSPRTITDFIQYYDLKSLRITVIAENGKVLYDSKYRDYSKMDNHSNRPEVRKALKWGSGYAIDRPSKSTKKKYFYTATYFQQSHLIIRTALPYDDNLAKSLKVDLHFIWFAIIIIVILTLVLWKFMNSLDANIKKLQMFASRAEHNMSYDTEELMDFPDDELGEIAEKIINIYKKLQSTRREQDILKRQLTQNVAHELKTPVATIQGYLETILDNPYINKKTKNQFLQRCYEQSQRLTSLLQDISTLNRLDDAPRENNFSDVDVAEIVGNIQHETSLALMKKHMEFVAKMPEKLVVKGNMSLIYGIFRNLTDNAINYAGKKTTISLIAEEKENEWKFIFSDNGIGVSEEHLPRIFERFYRIDKGRSRKLGGTGLGLAIVKNAVILHGGKIHATNLSSGGLCFTFTIKKNNDAGQDNSSTHDRAI